MNGRCLLLPFFFSFACSSATTGPAAPSDVGTSGDSGQLGDAGGDTSATDTGGSVVDSGSKAETGGSTSCGVAPFVKTSGKITVQGVGGSKPATGVKITSPACPEAVFTAAADGSYSVDVQQGLSSYSRINADGAIPAIVGESKATMDTNNVDVTLLPAFFKGFLPGWKSGEPAVFLKIAPAAMATGACADPSGVTISVMDQPGASIVYFDDKTPPAPMTGATATSPSGLVFIRGVTGSKVTLLGTKSGCIATTKYSLLTGVTSLEPDYLTEVAMQLAN